MARPVCISMPPATRHSGRAFGHFAPMNLYEVIFWGTGQKRDDDADTIYLVRAPDFRAAVEFVQNNSALSDHGEPHSLAHVVYEIGIDRSAYADAAGTQILRGPYFQCAYNFAWRAWERKIAGSDYTREWEEKAYVVPDANGGPATPVSNSGVTEGPPSVS
jgi:hypothetical protein